MKAVTLNGEFWSDEYQEFSNPLCLQACLQGFQSCQITLFIWYRILSVDTVKCYWALCWITRRTVFAFHLLLSDMSLFGTKRVNPATLRFAFFFLSLFNGLHLRLGPWIGGFYHVIGENKLRGLWLCIWVCAYARVSNITVTCTRLKNVLRKLFSEF